MWTKLDFEELNAICFKGKISWLLEKRQIKLKRLKIPIKIRENKY